MPLSTEHERAKFAYDKTSEFYKLEKEDKDKFESWAEKLPSMIVSCGLLQTVVFYKSKKEEEITQLYTLIEDWLKLKIGNNNTHNFNLIQYLTHRIDNVEEYLNLTDEALRLSIWIKRMAKILKENK